jgi:hypothetical protein
MRSRFYAVRRNVDYVDNLYWILETVKDVAKLAKFRYNFFHLDRIYIFMKATKEKNRYSRDDSAAFRVDISSYEPRVTSVWFGGKNKAKAKSLSWEWRYGMHPETLPPRPPIIKPRPSIIPSSYFENRSEDGGFFPFASSSSSSSRMYPKRTLFHYPARSPREDSSLMMYPALPHQYYGRPETKIKGMPGKFGKGSRKVVDERPAF